MFTQEQIKAAHAAVKSGADFPVYIKTIKALGVTHYEAFVEDGHIDYYGANDYLVQVPKKYDSMPIAETLSFEKFVTELKAHQQGKTDYLTFINMCAETGIEKWVIRMDAMTCVYFDKTGKSVLTEQIPEV